MDLVPSAVESLQATYSNLKSGFKNSHTPNSNNNVKRQSRNGSRSLSPFGTKVSGISNKLSYVERVVLEIIDTERKYVQDLRSIVEDYLGGIIDKQELPLKPEQVCALFGNIEDIYELNSELLQDLDGCSDDPVAVANCFVEKSQDFDIYTQYCNNYPNSVATLTECMRNKVLAKFFREKQEMLKQPLPLGAYLLKPVQRILKYHLLLQEIAKHFDIDKEGYEVVEEAIETMTGVAWYINDMKRKHEHAVRQQEIQSLLLNWKGMDLTTYGELVLEGTFRVQRARSERTFFLFDKALLITKKRGDHFVYKTHIPCASLMLIESTRDSLCFSLTHYKNTKQQHNVQAKTVEEKRLWTHHIKKLILENHHAIIPQKAKEAILEMDAMYTGRYRYSPERVKKAMSTVDPMVTLRSGRRQSEPTKHILKQLGEKVGLKSRDTAQHETSKGFKRQNSQSSGNPEKRRSVEATTFIPEFSEQMEKDQSEYEEVYVAKMVSTSEIPSEVPVQPSEDTQPVEEDRETDSDIHDPLENGVAENTDDSKTFSSEEDEEEASVHESTSILPPSVLDQASVIAERFVSFSRRSSLALEDGKVIGCTTPKLTSRSSSLINLDSADKILYHNGTSENLESHNNVLSDSEGANEEPALNKVNSVENVFEEKERPLCKRRESILSFQDRQLLDKIKTYYDKAEHQDASFSIKRRESLTYIPAGLVRNSIFKINSLPRIDGSQGNSSRQRLGSSSNNANAANGKPASRAEDASRTSKRDTEELTHHTSQPAPRSGALEHSISISDEEFKTPTKMIKVWDEIEKHSIWLENEEETRKDAIETSIRRYRNSESDLESHEPLIIVEESDLATIREESLSPTPESQSPQPLTSLTNKMDFSDQDYKTPVKLHPSIMQLASCMDGDLTEKMKNKVYQLARQYSQRIKCNKPAAHRHLRELEEDMRRGSLPSVQEEKPEDKCKLKPTLSLPISDHIALQEHSATTPTSAPFSEKSSKRLSFGSESPRTSSPGRLDGRSPLSPVTTEKFHWPDVRELRSRYTSAAGTNRSLLVNRSQSVPERMMDNTSDTQGKENLSQSHSMHMKHFDSANGIAEETKDSGKVSTETVNLNGDLVTLKSTRNSDQTVNDCYYISAEAPLENNKKVIVLEKLPSASSHELEDDDTFVHIRSPTTREKISLKAVIERCKAYQESDEYKSREDLSMANGSIDSAAHEHSKPEPRHTASGDTTQQSRVKNLREKFQTTSSSKHSDHH